MVQSAGTYEVTHIDETGSWTVGKPGKNINMVYISNVEAHTPGGGGNDDPPPPPPPTCEPQQYTFTLTIPNGTWGQWENVWHSEAIVTMNSDGKTFTGTNSFGGGIDEVVTGGFNDNGTVTMTTIRTADTQERPNLVSVFTGFDDGSEAPFSVVAGEIAGDSGASARISTFTPVAGTGTCAPKCELKTVATFTVLEPYANPENNPSLVWTYSFTVTFAAGDSGVFTGHGSFVSNSGQNGEVGQEDIVSGTYDKNSGKITYTAKRLSYDPSTQVYGPGADFEYTVSDTVGDGISSAITDYKNGGGYVGDISSVLMDVSALSSHSEIRCAA
jgi:hypothetical protein